MAGIVASACLAGATADIPYNKAIRQGGVESSHLFKTLMMTIVAPLVLYWRAQRLGLEIDGVLFPLVFYADNMWMLAASRADMILMLSQLAAALAARGLDLKRSSLCYMSNCPSLGKEDRPAAGL